MSRDPLAPLTDPQPGDVVKLINDVESTVVARDKDWDDDLVYAHLSNGRRVKIALRNWKRDCETAEVLNVA